MFGPGKWARVHSELRHTFGTKKLRPGQKQAIAAILAGRDLLCILPTGAGKSLCYQLPAMLLDGPTLVISPLISLMHDQVGHLTARGIPALCLDSRLSPEELEERHRRIARGEARLIYVAPERLQNARFLRAIGQLRLSMVVVDEAHCVVQWGRGFRPAYQQIGPFIGSLPVRPVVCAFTATADEELRRALILGLGMEQPKLVTQALIRPGLHYHSILTAEPEKWVTRYVYARRSEKGIVFCRTRAETERLARLLGAPHAACYHAGLDAETRQRTQDAFARGEIRVLTATSAFGMGVDIPDIRYVVHTSLPADVTDYVQQAGRAGRDGQPAACVLLISPQDLTWWARHLSSEDGKSEWPALKRLLSIALGGRCLSASFARAFGQQARRCGTCSVCLRRKQRQRRRLASVPMLRGMKKPDLSYWVLLTARERAALEKHVSPGRIASRRALERAAASGRLDAADMDETDWARLQTALDAVGRAL